jgi:glycosyltransferase involved in cell wall biosynthesis
VTPKLIIVQHKPTQFDAPLFEYIERQTNLSLLVYYTATNSRDWSVDAETGRKPEWDNLKYCIYQRRDLDAREVADAAGIAAEIAGHRPSLVIICGYTPLLYTKLALLLKIRGIRIGLRSDNTLRHSNFKGSKGLMKRLGLPFLLDLYDTWHPVGTLAKQYLQKMAIKERPVYLFPYNVDNDWFERESSKYIRQADAIRSSMGFSSNDFVVLGILKWNDREDPLTLIDAFALLRERQANARLIFVGDGPLRDKIHTKAEKLGASVCMPGYVPYSQLPKYYTISNIFVHPAPGEPWGVSVNEAMACGLPVIAAEGVGAGADLIVEGATGFIFPNCDSRGLCDKLLRLATDVKLLAGMSTAAKHKVSEWSYEHTCNEFLGALNR